MIRLDAFFTKLNIASRKEAKAIIKSGKVTVNNVVIKDNNYKVDEAYDIISYMGKNLIYEEFSYYILDKPSGYISATKDKNEKTVMDYFFDVYKDTYGNLEGLDVNNLFPVGRLDKDTTGLILITNDGELGHRALSPKYHVDKVYHVLLDKPLSGDDFSIIENGVDIGDYVCLPAKISNISDNNKECDITIHEGKFHQVKRMFSAINNEVIALRRLSFGTLNIEDLKGEVLKKLDQDELNRLKELIYDN